MSLVLIIAEFFEFLPCDIAYVDVCFVMGNCYVKDHTNCASSGDYAGTAILDVPQEERECMNGPRTM